MHKRLSVVLAGVGLLGAPSVLHAQALERHIAPGAPPPPEQKALQAPTPAVSEDDRILAPALTGMVLIGAQGGETEWPRAAAIEQRGVAIPSFAALELKLRSFLGKPLTLRLISQIQGVVTQHYRDLHRPFVAVAPPPQQVSAGVLRLRVIAFRLGDKRAKATSAALREHVLNGVRVQTGRTIDSSQLSQDLDWLAHSPFVQVRAAFSPSATVGATDMTLTTQRIRPWTVFADYSNSGSPMTGWDRYTVGGQGALPWLPGAFASYQMTGSGDAFLRHGEVLPLGDAGYLSHSLVATVPLAARQELALSLDYVTSLTPSQDFLLRQTTAEASLTYRFAVSNLVSEIPGDLSIGAEVRRQQRDTLFDSVRVASAAFDIGQATLGYSVSATDGPVRQSLSLTARFSPGGLDSRNSDRALAVFSNFRVNQSRYVYGDLDYSILAPLGGGFSYQSSLAVQVTRHPLSDTESLALGGAASIRGYTLDDGAFDEGAIWRNQLGLPGARGSVAAMSGMITPYLFADLGALNNVGGGRSADAASAGVGADGQFGPLYGGATLATTLANTDATRAGAVRILVHVGARF